MSNEQTGCHLIYQIWCMIDVSFVRVERKIKIGVSPLYCFCVHQIPQMTDIYIYIHLSLLLCWDLEGIPQSFEVLYFDVHLMWTREKHISPLACASRRLSLSSHPSPHCLVAPVFPLVVKIKKKKVDGQNVRNVLLLFSSVCLEERTSGSWVLHGFTLGMMWSELICQEATVFEQLEVYSVNETFTKHLRRVFFFFNCVGRLRIQVYYICPWGFRHAAAQTQKGM